MNYTKKQVNYFKKSTLKAYKSKNIHQKLEFKIKRTNILIFCSI